MNIVFVNHYHLDCNSGLHIFHLASVLSAEGHDCIVCVPQEKERVRDIGDPKFAVFTFAEARKEGIRFRDRRPPDFIHAWTPRELVREFTEEMATRYKCRYVIHLEDNEESLVARSLGISLHELRNLPAESVERISGSHMSHLQRYRAFIQGAAGVTVLIDRLLEFKPKNIPGEVIWPAYDPTLPWDRRKDKALQRKLALTDDHFVLVYTGNVHSANREEVFSLYLAVGLLNRKGIPVRLVRTGDNYVELFGEELAVLKLSSIELGRRPHNELPSILSLADVLVQPGEANEFNDYRFPSKLPEFLASGKPVVLPATNIGRYLKDGEECILLKEGKAIEIAEKVELLRSNEQLRSKVGRGGREFAKNNLNWHSSARKLCNFYGQLQIPGGVVGGDRLDGNWKTATANLLSP